MKVKTISQHFYESDDNGSFPIPFDGDFRTETLVVSEDGLTAKLGVVVHDEDCSDPFDNGDDEGSQFYQFSHNYLHYQERPEIDAFKRIIRANPGRVVTIYHYEHSNSLYKVADGPFTVANTKSYSGKTNYGPSEAEDRLYTADGYYIIPDDASNPMEYAKSILEEYTNWANGECFGVCVWEYKKVGEQWELVDRDNEVWGFIGEEYAEKELAERMEA